MMNWMNMAQRVLFDLGRSKADSRITEQKILGYLSDACHKIQSETGAVKCHTKITLDNPDRGEYKLPYSVKKVQRMEHSPTNDFPHDHRRINLMLIEAFDRMLFENRFNIAPQPIAGDQIFAKIKGCTLYLWPYATTGFIYMDFVPHLLPYSPDDTDDWAGYGTNPAPAMQANGPEAKLYPAIEGIIAYAKVQLVRSFPGELMTYRPDIPLWEKEFREGIKLVRKDNVDYQKFTRTPTAMGTQF